MTYILKRAYKEISVDELQQGMEIFGDVINKFGNVLIPGKTKVVNLDKIKNLLDHHNVEYVKVKVKKETEETEELDFTKVEETRDFSEIEERLNQIKKEEEIISFKQGFKINQVNVQKSFENILRGDTLGKDQLKENIDRTLENFKGSINVFQLMEKMKDLDDITYAHSVNVTVISHSIGKWLGLNPDTMESLVLSAMLIDIGKMKVPRNVLNKVEKLTTDELQECRNHVIYSHEMIKNYDFVNNEVKQAVLLHHERIDGSGYPMGAKENKIPLLARIIAIADVYNALTSSRPYRRKKFPFEAIKIMETEYRDKLDLQILYIFLNRIGNCFIGQKIKLSDLRTAEIVYVAKQNIYRPVVKIQNTGELVDLNTSEMTNLNIVNFV